MKRSFSNWITGLARHLRGPRPASPTRRVRPRVEALEERWAPACTVDTSGQFLDITGDDAANNIVINQNDDDNTIEVTCNGQLKGTYTSSSISAFSIALHGGKDTLHWNLVTSALKFSKSATIYLGTGRDEAHLNLDGPGNATLHGNLSIDLYAGPKDDKVTADFGLKHGGTLSFRADLGTGEDYCRATLAGDVLDASVSFNVNGYTGHDTLLTEIGYIGLNSIDISDDSSVAVVFYGGKGKDQLSANVSCDLDGDLYLDMNGELGNDKLWADMELLGSSSGSLDARLNGGWDDDYLYFRLREAAGSNVEIVNAVLNGSKGNDTWHGIKTTPNVTVKDCETRIPKAKLVQPPVLKPIGP